MKYKDLISIYYSDRSIYQTEVIKRKDSYNSINLAFRINNDEAFLINTWDMTALSEKIYNNAMKIQQLAQGLPAVAFSFYQQSCLFDEIQLSNDIEGVQSSRKEIKEAYVASENTKKRFHGIVKKYKAILHEDFNDIFIETVEGIRKLYDDIFADEIEKDCAPDGRLFRKNDVFVRDSRQNLIHKGVMPEEEIIRSLRDLILVLKNEEIPYLYRICIFHYYFGYIHPFYDGNGRMTRFISSYLLSKEFNSIIALGLSTVIKENRAKYYKIFKITNDKKNKGDCTPFTIQFLEFILNATENALEKLIQGTDLLNSVSSILNKLINKKAFTEKHCNMIYYLVQNELFASESDQFTLKELALMLNISWNTENRMLQNLLEKNIPINTIKKGNKKIISFDTEQFIKQYAYLITV